MSCYKHDAGSHLTHRISLNISSWCPFGHSHLLARTNVGCSRFLPASGNAISFVVPRVRLELTHLSVADFESAAAANYAIWANLGHVSPLPYLVKPDYSLGSLYRFPKNAWLSAKSSTRYHFLNKCQELFGVPNRIRTCIYSGCSALFQPTESFAILRLPGQQYQRRGEPTASCAALEYPAFETRKSFFQCHLSITRLVNCS